MRRRRLLRTGVGTGLAAGLSGCLGIFGGGGSSPPPRVSEVFEDVSLQGDGVAIQLENEVTVESRADVSASLAAGLSPVGVAAAQKGGGGGRGGRGAGGYAGAPRNPNGHAAHRADDDDWREDHEDEIERYRASIATLGVGYVGTDDQYEDDPPGPGPLSDWDRTMTEGSFAGETISVDVGREGWYRVGTELVAADGSHAFGWEALDFELDATEVDKTWKVSPRL
jgi:hypothetical protein